MYVAEQSARVCVNPESGVSRVTCHVSRRWLLMIMLLPLALSVLRWLPPNTFRPTESPCG